MLFNGGGDIDSVKGSKFKSKEDFVNEVKTITNDYIEQTGGPLNVHIQLFKNNISQPVSILQMDTDNKLQMIIAQINASGDEYKDFRFEIV